VNSLPAASANEVSSKFRAHHFEARVLNSGILALPQNAIEVFKAREAESMFPVRHIDTPSARSWRFLLQGMKSQETQEYPQRFASRNFGVKCLCIKALGLTQIKFGHLGRGGEACVRKGCKGERQGREGEINMRVPQGSVEWGGRGGDWPNLTRSCATDFVILRKIECLHAVIARLILLPAGDRSNWHGFDN